MSFLYEFSTPRTKRIHFEEAIQTTTNHKENKNNDSNTNTTNNPNPASSTLLSETPVLRMDGDVVDESDLAVSIDRSVSGQSTSWTGGSASPGSESLKAQLRSGQPRHNLSIATKARKHVETTLFTKRINDPNIDAHRIEALETYLPFLRTILTQYLALDETIRSKQLVSSSYETSLEWCTILLTGSRPNSEDRVPFFSYGKFDLEQEFAHIHFTLGLCHYQAASQYTFKAMQLANTIPNVSFLQLIPSFVAELQSTNAAAAKATPTRMFNPLSFIKPTKETDRKPKTDAEIEQIKQDIITSRKHAVQELRLSSGIFEYLFTYVSSLPIPKDRRIPDTMPAISTAMANLALIHVQQLTILSGLLNAASSTSSSSSSSSSSSVSPLLLSKLCQGIVTHVLSVTRTLESGVGSFYRALEQSFHEFLRLTSEYYASMRLVFLAIDADATGDHGRAITLLQHGCEQLKKSGSIQLSSIRECNPVISEWKTHLQLESQRVETLLKRFEKDNSNIYHQTIPKWNDVKTSLLEGEDGVFMAKSIPFTPHTPLQATFI